jgi:Virulence-associated protein E
MIQSPPTFDATTATDFLCLRYQHETAALVLNYRDGLAVPTGAPDRFDLILGRAKEERAHLFFHVADLTPEWADPASHAKGKVTTASKSHVKRCWYLWLDCDPEKYVGNDPSAAEAHYALQATEILKRINDGLAELGIAPSAMWSSGAGWQVLIQLDEPISPEEAERLVARLHILLGFDPVVRNSNRLLRVPGSINWKNGNDGRVPTPCSPCHFFGGEVDVEHVRRVLADEVSTPVRANVVEPLPVSIDWTKALNLVNVFTIDSLRARGVEEHALASLEHGDDRLNLHERHKAIGHRVNLGPYQSDSETLIGIAGALLRAQLSPEEASAVLGTATFAGCKHATKQKSDNLKRRAIMRAVGNAGNESLRQQHRAAAIAAGEPAWRDLNKKSLSPLATVYNIRLALVAMGIGVRLDLFRDRIIVTYSGSEHVLQESVSEVLTDRAENAICKYIDERWGFDSTDQQLHRAIQQTAVEHSFDPILDYLNEVERKWDGVERLKRAAVDYFEAEDTPLNNGMIEATLVGSVRRARVPGSKFDSIMTLESTEGFNKSGAIALLYG